jgi:hypothetical protein
MLPYYHMASFPPRMYCLFDSIPSILHQCKHLFIYLNNYNGFIPSILNNKRITIYQSEHEIGDTGDVGKFYNCDSWDRGYHCTVDDKIIYPKNYSEFMMGKVDEYKRKAVVSVHGRNFHPDRPSQSYYRDTYQLFQCTSKCDEQFVHNIGTGVMCFHTDTVTPEWAWFPHLNMTDIYMSLELQKRQIPMLLAQHPNMFVSVSDKKIGNFAIHKHLCNNDALQTSVINSFKWKIYKVAP